MAKTDKTDAVEALIVKAASAFDGNEAMKFSQAALNVANARATVKVTKVTAPTGT